MEAESTSLDRFDAVLGRLYDAALDYGKWSDALAAIREFFGARSVVVILLPHTGGPTDFTWVFQDDFQEYIRAIPGVDQPDPFDSIPPGRVTAIEDLFTEKEWRAARFYQEICKPGDVFDIMGAHARLTDGSLLRLGVTRSESSRRFDPMDKNLLARLMPHFRKAIEIHVLRTRAELIQAQYVGVCDRMGIATFILDGKGDVLESNATAKALLEHGDGLRLADGRLTAVHGSSRHALSKLISDALERRGEGKAEQMISDAMPVIRITGKASLGLFVQAFPAEAVRTGRNSPALIVFVRDPELRTEAPIEIMQRLFKLTPAETAVAQQVVNGLSIEETAENLGISPNTTKAHLRGIFVKTGAQRQSTLIRMILSSIVPLCADLQIRSLPLDDS